VISCYYDVESLTLAKNKKNFRLERTPQRNSFLFVVKCSPQHLTFAEKISSSPLGTGKIVSTDLNLDMESSKTMKTYSKSPVTNERPRDQV
jgi:hypothetical protein